VPLVFHPTCPLCYLFENPGDLSTHLRPQILCKRLQRNLVIAIHFLFQVRPRRQYNRGRDANERKRVCARLSFGYSHTDAVLPQRYERRAAPDPIY